MVLPKKAIEFLENKPRNYRWAIEEFFNFYAGKINDIDVNTVKRFLDFIKEVRSAYFLARILGIFLKDIGKNAEITKEIKRFIKKVRPLKPQIELSQKEWDEFLKEADEIERVIITLIRSSDIKISELEKITTNNVDLKNGIIIVDGKKRSIDGRKISSLEYSQLRRFIAKKKRKRQQLIDIGKRAIEYRIKKLRKKVNLNELTLVRLRNVQILSDDLFKEELGHSQIQGMLLHIGNIAFYETLVAITDKSKKFGGKQLLEIATQEQIPKFIKGYEERAKNTDVIWYKESKKEACFFEIALTTKIRDALWNLYHFEWVQSRLFIVAPSNRFEEFKRELEAGQPYSKMKRLKFLSLGEVDKCYHNASSFQKELSSWIDKETK